METTIHNYKCPQCGNTVISDAAAGNIKCSFCGCSFDAKYQTGVNPNTQGYSQQRDIFSAGSSGKSRGMAGLLAIILGSLGIHYFYLGKITAGIICLLLTLLSCGLLGCLIAIATIIQGAIMMGMTEQDFEQKYVYSNSTFPI